MEVNSQMAANIDLVSDLNGPVVDSRTKEGSPRTSTGHGTSHPRPPLPEKPPVATKPKRKPPPSPPKPSITLNKSQHSPSKSSQPQFCSSLSPPSEDVLHNNITNYTKYDTPPSSPDIMSNSGEKDGQACLADDQTRTKSPEPPPLPLSPPPTQRKSSLTANSKARPSSPPASLAILNPQLSSSSSADPVSPISSSPKSPERHISPPRRTAPPPATKPKPQKPLPPGPKQLKISLKTSNDENSGSDNTKALCEDGTKGSTVPVTNKASEAFPSKEEIPLTVTSPPRPMSPPSRPSAPPKRPTSPPSRPLPPSRPSPPSRPAPVAKRKPGPPASTTSASPNTVEANVNVNGTTTSVVAEEVNSPAVTEKKLAPPPLPKNPPRGGIPRKPRGGSLNSGQIKSQLPVSSNSSTLAQKEGEVLNKEEKGDANPAEVEVCPPVPVPRVSPVRSPLTSKNSADGATSIICVENKSQVAKDCVSLLDSDKNLKNNINQETTLEKVVSESDHSISRPSPPRPVPRKRLSIPSSPSYEAVVGKSGEEKTNNHCGVVSEEEVDAKCTIVAEVKEDEVQSFNNVVELDYAEVYRGDSEEKELLEENVGDDDEGNESSVTESKNQVEEKTCAISVVAGRTDCETLSANVPSGASIVHDTKHLIVSEPESTCGMLKEIEELLKSKLQHLDLESDTDNRIENLQSKDIETLSQENNWENQGHSCLDVTAEDRPPVQNTYEDSQQSTPVRPPRPKRQASINRHKGSLESLDSSSIDGSSSECLAPRSKSPTLTDTPEPAKKVVPPKPKRMTLPRVGRSQSDASCRKSYIDQQDEETSQRQKDFEEVKPALPPRLESLKRGGNSPCSTPPPLPPRNKPRSASFQGLSRTDSECDDFSQSILAQIANISIDKSWDSDSDKSSMKSLKSCVKKQEDSSKIERKDAVRLRSENPKSDAVSVSESKTDEHQSSAMENKVKALRRPARPARKAPPPPPTGQKKRATTFSPGDKALQTSENRDNKQSKECLRSSAEVKTDEADMGSGSNCSDHDYHEIPAEKSLTDKHDHLPKKAPRRLSSPANVLSLPPELPPRGIVQGTDTDKVLSKDAETDKISDVKSSKGERALEDRVSPSEINRSQILREKQAKAALVRKVSQDLKVDSCEHAEKCRSVKTVETASRKEMTKADTLNNSGSSNEQEGSESEVMSPEEESSLSLTKPERPPSEVSEGSSSSGMGGEDEEGEFGLAVNEEEETSESESEPEPEHPDEIYVQRKALKVFNIAREISTSEATFADVLRLLNIDFRLHISQQTEKLGQPVIPTETLNKILDCLPQMLNFSEDLVKDLSERIKYWDKNPRIADIFVKKGPFLKLYSSYIQKSQNATALLDETCKKNPMFAAALKEFEMGPRCASLALKHYMLKPIQRIPQYRMLLQEYLKNLSAESADYKDTQTALNIVIEVAGHANESMKQGDIVQKLMEIQRSLIGQFEVIQPGREFLKKGELQKLSRKEMQPRMFFLFNDVLLYTTSVTSGFKVNNILPLSGMKINSPNIEDYKFEFNIISVQRSFTVCASTSEEKESWLKALHEAIDENAKRFHTFEAGRQAPETSLQDKDFVLGDKAPLWVPDARVTMCQLCLATFTITWRRHHCRSCGRIICSHCSSNKAPLKYLSFKSARVCDNCYDKLEADFHIRNPNKGNGSVSEEDTSVSVSEPSGEDLVHDGEEGKGYKSPKDSVDSNLSINSLKARFQKIRKSAGKGRKKTKDSRPSVLKEVHANDEGSDLSGYLYSLRSGKWKKLWFVVKENVLYTYKASEDMAAVESMPLLGYEVDTITASIEGADPSLLFELSHQNTQAKVAQKEGSKLARRTMVGLEKATQRSIYRTDSPALTTKWVTVLREASLTT